MTNVIAFPSQRRGRARPRREAGPATIILFHGVRRERAGEAGSASELPSAGGHS